MFPDPTARWVDHPSPIDGILPPPFVFDLGVHKGVLRLVVSPPAGGVERHFRIAIACEIYFGVEEMIYSTAGHGDGSGSYGGQVFIKQASASRLLDFWRATDPANRPVKHFLFAGADFCYESVGFGDPAIHAFESEGEAHDWARA